MLKNALSDTVNWQTRKWSNCTNFQVLVWVIINSSKRNSNLFENCQKFFLKIVLKCLYLARSGRPDILSSVNKLERSVTKWTQACDRRLARPENIGKVLNKEVDLGEPTSFLDHVYLGCTQRQCEISKDVVDNYSTMFESRISAAATEKLPCSENLRISSWSYDMEGHAKKCVERYCELANKTTQQLCKVSTPCIDDHHFNEEDLKSDGDLPTLCSQIVLKCLYLARIGRPDILWSVNKLARSITKWTKACDKRLARWISYIHHTCEFRQYCNVANTAQQCRLGFFQDCDFAGDLEDSKSTSGGVLCIFGSGTFVLVNWMYKNQTAVSHSSTESEILSLGAGLRMDGLFALDLWDPVIEVLRSNNNNVQPKHTSIQETGAVFHSKTKTQHVTSRQRLINWVMLIMCPPTHSFQNESQLYIFWRQWSRDQNDNSRTKSDGETRIQNPQSCSCLVVWSNQFGTYNLNQIHLTPKTNSRTYWPREVSQELNGITFFVCSTFWSLFNILNFSMYSCSHSSDFLSDDQVGQQSAMSERGQKTTSNEGSPTPNAKPCLVVHEQRSEEISSRSLGSMVNPRNADERKEVVQASRQLVQPDSNSEVWYSQASRQENVAQASRQLVQGDQNQTESDERKYSDSTSSRKVAASSPKLKNIEHTNRNILNVSIQNKCIDMENVYDFVDESRHPPWAELCVEFGNLQEHKIRGDWECIQHDSKVGNGAFWRNSEYEILEYSSLFSARSVFDNDQAIKWAKAKVCVCADSVLCVGQMRETPEAKERWKGQVEGLRLYSSYQYAVGIDWESIEIEWNTFPGFSSLSSLREQGLEGEKEHPARGVQGPDHVHVNVQWHVEHEWWELCFECWRSQELLNEILARTLGILGSRGRKRSGMAILLTRKKGNGIVLWTKWCHDSKKLVILYSQASVPWVVESTSTEIRWTQNSCSKQFIL